MTNRFKGFYLIYSVPEELWMEVCILEAVTTRFQGLDLIHRVPDGGSRHCTGGSDQDQPQEKEMQKGKMLVLGGLTNSCEKKISEKQRRKGKI